MVKNRRYCTNNNGFTFIEVIVAIFILSTGILSLVVIVDKSIASVTEIKTKFIAAYLAQEGIEIIRNIRDTNWLEGATNSWDEGLSVCGSPSCDWEVDYATPSEVDPTLNSYNENFLYIEGATGFYRYISFPLPDDIQTKFKRKVSISDKTANSFKVSSKVEWEIKGNSYNIEAVERLYNWK